MFYYGNLPIKWVRSHFLKRSCTGFSCAVATYLRADMINEQGSQKRTLKNIAVSCQLAIVGGGFSGVCAAITAARKGVKVCLVQDRPVLGGNASSEVRLWILGATSHMGNNNRWSREGGLVDEILVENTYQNSEGNSVIFDSILLDKVISEPNITLLLNTAVFELDKDGEHKIKSITAFCSQNATQYTIAAPLFCDASGDGILGFLAGAAFRMGAESAEEFGEKFAPSADYGELLGHSLYFYSKDTGKPVKYIPPAFALSDISKIPRFKTFNAKDFGCKLWWVEYGGRLDTIHDTEAIKWELWKVIYGTWNYIKNSGNFPEAENLTLEWAGTIPGKRESRRFEGDYLLRQQDIVEQHSFYDAVGYGGWSIDLHPADGVFSEKPGCNQWHSKGIFQVPYRCLYSKNITNLFLAGRIISATHVAFGATRVMATVAYLAQVVAHAARICLDQQLMPAMVATKGYLPELQQELLRSGHYIPGFNLKDPLDLVGTAQVSASSHFKLSGLPVGGERVNLNTAMAQLLPIEAGMIPKISITAFAEKVTKMEVALMGSSKAGNFTPDVLLEAFTLEVKSGNSVLELNFSKKIPRSGYYFITLKKNPLISLNCSDVRVTGILTVYNQINKAVSNYGKQTPPADIGVDEFEFWCPKRRPEGHNLAFGFSPELDCFQPENICNGIDRPVDAPNAWVADPGDESPGLLISWEEPVKISVIDLFFDADYDHPMESVLMGHPETVMPFCVRDYNILDDQDRLVYQKSGNYQTRNQILLAEPIRTSRLKIRLKHPSANVPAAVFAVRCYH